MTRLGYDVRAISAADWPRIKQIAGDAWELPDGERESYVQQACADNEALRIEVINLLRAMIAASGALDRIVISGLPSAAAPRSADPGATDRKQDRSSDK